MFLRVHKGGAIHDVKVKVNSPAATVVDLGSANGTTVDSERLTEAKAVAPGGRITCGAAVVANLGVPVDDRPNELERRPLLNGARSFYRPPPQWSTVDHPSIPVPVTP